MLSSAKPSKWGRLAIPALVILVTLGLFHVPGFAGTYNIPVTADCGVMSSAPTSNYGTDTQWLVGQYGDTLAYYETYLKFDLSSIPPDEQITGGILYARCASKFPPTVTITIELRPVSDTGWIESGTGGITWDEKPAYGDLITTALGNVGWDHWNIPAAKLPPTGLVSFMLRAANSGYAYFYSRENDSNKPYLQITTTKKTAAPRYSYLNLGFLPNANYSDPWSINNSGQVAGTSGNTNTFGRAFLKTLNEPMVDLNTLEGEASSGYDINDAGQVVGEAQNALGNWRAFLKNPGELMSDLELGNGSYATAINASGQVVGQAQNSSGVWRAFLKTPGHLVEDLGALGGPTNTSYANEINAYGQVVGQAQNSSGFGRAFLKTPGQDMADLDTLGGNESEAMHINSSGQVVGGAQNAAGLWRAFLKNPGQLMQDLGTLGGNESGAVGFNNAGQVVGSADVDASTTHPFLWDKGVMYDLNNLTVNLPPGAEHHPSRPLTGACPG